MTAAAGSSRKARVLILSYHFHPSPAVGARRMTALATALRDAGHAVTVVAAERGGPPGDGMQGMLDGIAVRRIPVPEKWWPRLRARFGRSRARSRPVAPVGDSCERGRESLPALLKRQVNALEWLLDDCKRWSFRALLMTLRLALVRRGGRPYDILITSGPPMSVHVAAWLARPVLGTRWIMDLRDPWVGNSYWPSAVRSAARERLESLLERRCMARADWITAAAPGIARRVLRRHPELDGRVRLILNGYDDHAIGSERPPAGKLHLLYAGSLYYNRDPFPLLCAVGRLLGEGRASRDTLHLTFLGECEEWGGIGLSGWARQHGLEECVTVHAPVAPDRIAGFIAAAHVLVVFAQAQPEQIPAKVYECIAAGREMLVLAERDGDTGRLVEESGSGRIVEPGDDEGLLTTLRELHAFYVERREIFEPPPEMVARFSRTMQNRAFFNLMGADG